MSVICGKCGNIIFVSNRKDWTTNKQHPELMCDECENAKQTIHYSDIIKTYTYVPYKSFMLGE